MVHISRPRGCIGSLLELDNPPPTVVHSLLLLLALVIRHEVHAHIGKLLQQVDIRPLAATLRGQVGVRHGDFEVLILDD